MFNVIFEFLDPHVCIYTYNKQRIVSDSLLDHKTMKKMKD